MAKRFSDTELWDKGWFMALSQKHKLLIQFLFSKCDGSGVWDANYALASVYVGESVTKNDICALSEQAEILENGKIFLPDFVHFQYGKLTEKCKPHLKVIELLKKHNLFERVYKGYTKGINTLEEKEEEKEEDSIGNTELSKLPREDEKFPYPIYDTTVIQPSQAPTMQSVIEFFYQQGKTDPKDAEKFYNYHSGLGWRKGITPILNWRSFANSWIANPIYEHPEQQKHNAKNEGDLKILKALGRGK
jgi:hypothetical protein